MADRELIATPEEYKQIFEDNRVGQKIYEDLLLRFGRQCDKGSGIDRVLDQFQYSGRREIIEFITLRVNQANGVRTQGETIDLGEQQ